MSALPKWIIWLSKSRYGKGIVEWFGYRFDSEGNLINPDDIDIGRNPSMNYGGDPTKFVQGGEIPVISEQSHDIYLERTLDNILSHPKNRLQYEIQEYGFKGKQGFARLAETGSPICTYFFSYKSRYKSTQEKLFEGLLIFEKDQIVYLGIPSIDQFDSAQTRGKIFDDVDSVFDGSQIDTEEKELRVIRSFRYAGDDYKTIMDDFEKIRSRKKGKVSSETRGILVRMVHLEYGQIKI